MLLISCEKCGVVLDKDRFTFPKMDDIYNEHGEPDRSRCVYDPDRYPFYVPSVPCPICHNAIRKN